MSVEEELLELSTVVAGQRERIADMEELILDWMLLMHSVAPWSLGHGDGLLLQERARELGVVERTP